ncbi:MAG: hypothetical protein NTW33_10305 [Methanoregula sp.]|nr:hypothetical protein [Methanoregula sp.]
MNALKPRPAGERPNDNIYGASETEHSRQAKRIADMAVSVSLTMPDPLVGLMLNVVFVCHGVVERFSLHTSSQRHELTDKLWELLPDEGEHRTGKLTGDLIDEILKLWFMRINAGAGVQP